MENLAVGSGKGEPEGAAPATPSHDSAMDER
jgi:hypothetical protein